MQNGVIPFAMIPSGIQEIWVVMLYCILTWVAFSGALYLADNLRRPKEAMLGGLLILVLASVLSMLTSFAAEQLQTGIAMNLTFQLTGILLCAMAVSRVMQMLSWPRTWLVGLFALFFYTLSGVLIGWGIVLLA